MARLPFSTDQLHVTILYDEPRVVIVPVDHRLAGRQSVTVDDIADEPIPKLRDCDPAWNAFWRIDPRPDGRRAPDGPLFETLEDGLELVAAGQAVAVSTEFHERLRPDITTVPLDGVDPEPCRLGEPRRGPQPSGGGLSQTRRKYTSPPQRGTQRLKRPERTGSQPPQQWWGADGIEPPTAGV